MRVNLHKYQQHMVDFALDGLFARGEPGVGWFADPGLGKTLCTLEVLRTLFDLGEAERALVVAPKRVCELVWPAEIEKWGYPFGCNVMCGKVDRAIWNAADIDVVNPESLHKLTDHAGKWDVLVVDESTKFKNWSSKRMKSMRKLLPSIPKRMILTGTPASNSLADLHSQLFICDGGERLGKNVTVFRAQYMQQGGYMGRQWVFRKELEGDIHGRIADIVLRMDAESNLDMPELLTHDMFCRLPPRAEREYARLKRDLLAQLESGDVLCSNAASAYQRCRQLANGATYDDKRQVHQVHDEKLDMLDELVDELSGKPLLCFYQFQHDAARILKRHPKARVLSGATKGDEAAGYVKAWNNDEVPLFLVQAQAASHGLNLQGGSCADVAWMGLGDSAEIYDQAVRRVYRQGVKSRCVRVHRLLCARTVDVTIRDRLEGKFATQSQFLEALKRHAQAK